MGAKSSLHQLVRASPSMRMTLASPAGSGGGNAEGVEGTDGSRPLVRRFGGPLDCPAGSHGGVPWVFFDVCRELGQRRRRISKQRKVVEGGTDVGISTGGRTEMSGSELRG